MDLKDISVKWQDFGIKLGISLDRLEKIRSNTTDRDTLTTHCFNRVIHAWLTGNGSRTSKENLTAALRNMDRNVLANQIDMNQGQIITNI